MTNDEERTQPEDEEEVHSPPPHGHIPPEGQETEPAEEAEKQGEIAEEGEVPSPPPHGRVPPEAPPAEGESHLPSLADLDIYDTLRFLIGVLNQAAWIHLGLVVPPGASEAKTDLAQARVAIDSLEALGERLRPAADPAEQRELDNVLANLRINYVKKAE